jgi:hypothetical protein
MIALQNIMVGGSRILWFQRGLSVPNYVRDLCLTFGTEASMFEFKCKWEPTGLKRKAGAKPARSRRCNRGRNLHKATFLLYQDGKAQGVGRSGSQKTYPFAGVHCHEVWQPVNPILKDQEKGCSP